MRRLGAALGLAFVLSTALPGAADAATIERTYNVGNEPFGVTIDPADGRIYVANSDGGSNNPGHLSVVDPAASCSPSSPCVTAIALASPPTMSALDRALGRLFVTTANRTLTFVDIATRSVVNTVPNAGGLGVAVDEANHAVYAAAVTSLSMVDGVTGTVLHTAPAGVNDSWWGVALDATARRVYVTNLDTGGAPSLVILSADDLSLIDEVALPEIPRLALAVDTARQLVYVGGFSGAGRLYVIDANTRQITTTVDLQAGASVPFSATLVAREDRLYLSQTSIFGPNSIVVLDLATLQVVQRIPLPWLPGATALHANGRLYVAGLSADVLAAMTLTNSAPVIDSVSMSPVSPRTNDVLQAGVAAHDADGDALAYSYEWLRNGAVIAGATGASLDLAAPGHGNRGDTVTARVRASDGQAMSAPATASVIVVDTAPTAGVALDVTSPTTDQTITATATSADADGDAVTYTFTWKINGVVRSTASGATSASSSFDLSGAGNGDRGQTVSVEVRASDGTLESAVAAASAVVANSAPTVTVSLSDATPRSNDVLVATANAQDADVDPLTLSYAWSVNGVVKQAGASDRFDLMVKGQGDKGDVISVTVTSSDGTAGTTANANATVTNGKH